MPGGLIPPTEPTPPSLDNHSRTRELSNLLRRETITPGMATGCSCSTLQNRPSPHVYPKQRVQREMAKLPTPATNALRGPFKPSFGLTGLSHLHPPFSR